MVIEMVGTTCLESGGTAIITNIFFAKSFWLNVSVASILGKYNMIKW